MSMFRASFPGGIAHMVAETGEDFNPILKSSPVSATMWAIPPGKDALNMDIPRETLLELYRIMLTIRRFEERCIRDFESGAIPGLVHSYMGEEAIATGICAHLRRD